MPDIAKSCQIVSDLTLDTCKDFLHDHAGEFNAQLQKEAGVLAKTFI